MTVQSNFSAIRGIPLKYLYLSPLNVRKDDADEGIADLAESIKAEGVVQNLVGHEDEPAPGDASGEFARTGVVAGGRRWRGLQLLLQQGKITEDYIVPCLVTSKEAAIAISLAENSDRKPLHPADEFEAARALVDAGKTIEEVADRLRLSPLTVQRRLKLANVAPEFIKLYREGEITLEHLMAFAITDDHAKQQKVWKGLRQYERRPAAIRDALTETEVSVRDPLARFVTLKAYEKAGGQCRRDLFSDDDEVSLLNLELLNDLARKKLGRTADKLKKEGLAWVDVQPRVDYADQAGYGRVQTSQRPPNEEERAELENLDRQFAEIDAAEREATHADEEISDDAFEAFFARKEQVEEAREAVLAKLCIPDPQQQAKSGALVCIGRDGRLKVEANLLRGTDAKLFAAQARKEARTTGDKAPSAHSAALCLSMTSHRTLALRAAFAQSPDVALAAVVHRFVINTIRDDSGRVASGLQFESPEVPLSHSAEDLENTLAHMRLKDHRGHFESLLPEDPQMLFPWILKQPLKEKLALLAFCAALGLNAVQKDERESEADALARALKLDLRQWWKPTAEGYLNRIPKAAILQAISEAVSPEAAVKLQKLDKRALVAEADKALEGTGWLPQFLRSAWTGTPPAP